jgi:acetyl esterase/lipase
MKVFSVPVTLVLLVLITFLAGCVSHQRNTPAEPVIPDSYQVDRILEDIVYTETGWSEQLKADLYLPAKKAALPVVLMIHGGSWSTRGRGDMTDLSMKLTRHGYAVLNVSYRFAPAHIFPAQLLDLHQALRWLSDNADRYGLDTTRINAWGYSSGAHLAALVASYNLDAPQDASKDLPGIRAVVAGGIPSDLRKYPESPIVKSFLGGSYDELPKRYADASPAYHISADDPPVFLYHGKLDVLVTRDQATDYYAALLANGIDAELYQHALRGHTTMFIFGGDAEDRAIDFLNRKNVSTMTGGL